jgi:hypothetical protein
VNRSIRMSATVCAIVFLPNGCSKGPSLAPSPETTTPPVVVAAPRTALSHIPVTAEIPSTPHASTPHADSIRELSPLVPRDPRDLEPHRLRLILDEEMNIHELYINNTYISDDGSTAIVLIESDERYKPHTLLIRPLDDPDKAIDLPLLNKQCEGPVGRQRCRRPEADKQIATANKLLAKHKWVRFAQGFLGEHPNLSESGCGGDNLDRHSRIPGFDIEYKIVDALTGVHLRIVRDDGAVITDNDFQPHTPGESEECRLGTMPYINDLGYDLERRAMYVFLVPCYTEGCPIGRRFLFFRLPPLPKAAGDTTAAPKRKESRP